jgi:hypothetical protein
MKQGLRVAVILALFIGVAPAAEASVQVVMTVEGPRGPFATGDYNAPGALKLTSAQLDFVAAVPGPLVSPRPVVVARRTDQLSWEFMECLSTGDRLRVVIVATQSDQNSGGRHRRIVTLSGARVLSIHTGSDTTTTDDQAAGLGTETIAFTYERLDVEDDGVRIFTTGA